MSKSELAPPELQVYSTLWLWCPKCGEPYAMYEGHKCKAVSVTVT